MLSVTVPGGEMWNEATETFESLPDTVLQLEHSLISLSKWEAKWKRSFISANELTPEQMLDYVHCMTINKVNQSIYARLTLDNLKDIRKYIDDPMTATTINRGNKPTRTSRKVITSEQIYGWMVGYGIPFDPCEKWHLNRLMMLIEVCGIQQGGGKKMSQKEQGAWMRAQHAARSKRGHQ